MPTSFSVANETDLNNAIAQIDVGGASAATVSGLAASGTIGGYDSVSR